MKEEIKKKNANKDENLILKRKNEKKKAIIVVLLFAFIIVVMLSILFYVTLKSDISVASTECDTRPAENKTQTLSNSYQMFSNNLKKKITSSSIRSYMAKDSTGYSANDEITYKVILTNKMELIMTFDEEKYQKKYGEVKIADNVISFTIAQTGPGAYQNIYFIKEDGTVGEAIPMNLFNGEIKKLTITYPIEKLKNIVSIVNIAYQEGGYMQEPAFIDIDGNIFEVAMSAWD